MLSDFAAHRSDRAYRVIAGSLAFIGGFVNSAGFVLLGAFTSHVTGNVGRFANDVASRRFDVAALAATMILAFLVGAFVSSMAIETGFFGRASNAYAAALAIEAVLLLTFTAVASHTLGPRALPWERDLEAAILCAAMGMQNSLVTRLSGAVVRTTHLTGVLTDIGIEGARWFRWWRASLSTSLKLRLAFGGNPAQRPLVPKILLLLTIASAFTLGAVAGALIGVATGTRAMLWPGLTVALFAAYAYANRRRRSEAPDPVDARR